MTGKKSGNQRTGGKACIICGERGQARINGEFWFCGEHARELVMLSLMAGQPVVEAIRGKPQYLLMPTAAINKN